MDHVSLETAGQVARLTIERPERRNALTSTVTAQLIDALASIGPDDARVIVLTGRGSSFCAGADLVEYETDETGESRYAGLASGLDQTCRAIGEHPLPVVAWVNGHAMGGGATLALACDLRYAHQQAVIGIPAAKLGIVLNYPNVRRVVALAGPSLASEMLIGARILGAADALAAGLFNRLFKNEDAFDDAIANMASLAPLSLRSHKRAIRMLLEPGGESEATAAEINRLCAEAFASNDLQEGIAAFGARRPPQFGGN